MISPDETPWWWWPWVLLTGGLVLFVAGMILTYALTVVVVFALAVRDHSRELRDRAKDAWVNQR